jgi:hypothetical protein
VENFSELRDRFSRCHLTRLQIILRGNAKGVGNAIKKCEHGRDVNGLRDLIFFPACFSQLLNIFRAGAMSGIGDLLDVVQQESLRGGETGVVQLAF